MYIVIQIKSTTKNILELRAKSHKIDGEMEMVIEIKLIREWETFNNDKGYNIEFGGNVQKIIPQTTRDRISKALRGHECSEQTKIKISKAKKGKPKIRYQRMY